MARRGGGGVNSAARQFDSPDIVGATAIGRSSHAAWEDFYNYHRPHGAFAGKTPYEALQERLQ